MPQLVFVGDEHLVNQLNMIAGQRACRGRYDGTVTATGWGSEREREERGRDEVLTEAPEKTVRRASLATHSSTSGSELQVCSVLE